MLTARQAEILRFIRQYQRTEHVPPSGRVIQRYFGLSAQSGVRQHLAALAREGCLEQFADGRWGCKETIVEARCEVPLLGSIPAGTPSLREQEPEAILAIDLRLFGLRQRQADRLFALRVTGDSMIDAHIVSGDVLLLEWREPRLGDVIAALVDETAVTLKRVVRERGRLVLRAANVRYPDMKPARLEAQGVVVGVVRAYSG